VIDATSPEGLETDSLGRRTLPPRFDLLIAVDRDGCAMLVDWPEVLGSYFDGVFADDNGVTGVPRDMGLWRCTVEGWYADDRGGNFPVVSYQRWWRGRTFAAEGAPRLLTAGELDAIRWRVDPLRGGPGGDSRQFIGVVRRDVPALLAHIAAQEARIAALEDASRAVLNQERWVDDGGIDKTPDKEDMRALQTALDVGLGGTDGD